MRSNIASFAVAVCVVAAAACSPSSADERVQRFTFSWQFAPDDEMRPRGGTTRGPDVQLLEGPSAEWQALREPGLSDQARDRRAILAMAGEYRTSFDFLETVAFQPDYRRARPYQSWATERVYVDEDRGDFIALQHILVMFFEDEDGEVHGPVVQKHWRQEWQWQDDEIHAYAGHNRWRRERLEAEAVRGTWSQTVMHVDDSPRYEAVGRWVHEANYSAWTSDGTWRPLPQREHTVRDDYHVLAGINRHTITPGGWVHEQDNLKLVLDEEGKPAGAEPYLARELGVNRYERIVDFDFAEGERYRQRTDPYWQDVRAEWERIRAARDELRLVEERDGRTLLDHTFGYAERLYRSAEEYDADEGRRFVRRTLAQYVE